MAGLIGRLVIGPGKHQFFETKPLCELMFSIHSITNTFIMEKSMALPTKWQKDATWTEQHHELLASPLVSNLLQSFQPDLIHQPESVKAILDFIIYRDRSVLIKVPQLDCWMLNALEGFSIQLEKKTLLQMVDNLIQEQEKILLWLAEKARQ